MSFRTIAIQSSCKCSYQNGYLVVRKSEGTSKVHLSEVSSIVLQTQQVFLSAYLLSELAKNKISLVVSDEKHNPIGQYLPLYGAHNVSKKIQEQLAWTEPSKKRVWQSVIREKIRHQADVLACCDRKDEAHLLMMSVPEVRSGDITNREAQAARLYFAALFGNDFTRDSDLSVNAFLNYGYSLLLSMVNKEIVARGYLTQCGICHKNEYNQFNLACDLMEPFRPIVDLLAVQHCGLDFTKEDKLLLIDLPNRMFAYRDGLYHLGSIVSLYVQDCLNALNRKIDISEIAPYELG